MCCSFANERRVLEDERPLRELGGADAADTLPRFKSLHQPQSTAVPATGWDFALYPNPTRDGAWLRFDDDAPKDIVIFDALGRTIVSLRNVSDATHYLDMTDAAKGLFWVQVTSGASIRTRKLLIH